MACVIVDNRSRFSATRLLIVAGLVCVVVLNLLMLFSQRSGGGEAQNRLQSMETIADARNRLSETALSISTSTFGSDFDQLTIAQVIFTVCYCRTACSQADYAASVVRIVRRWWETLMNTRDVNGRRARDLLFGTHAFLLTGSFARCVRLVVCLRVCLTCCRREAALMSDFEFAVVLSDARDKDVLRNKIHVCLRWWFVCLTVRC